MSMKIKCYWLFDVNDYKNFDIKNSKYKGWEPEFEFTNASQAKETRESIENNEYNINYLKCKEYDFDISIMEEFELGSFPLDCQDLPVIIEPKNFKRYIMLTNIIIYIYYI